MPPNLTPNSTSTPNANPEESGPAPWILVAGGLLLAVGIGLIVFAVTSSDKIGVVADRLDAGQLAVTTPAAPSGIETITPSPKATKAKRPRATKNPAVAKPTPTATAAKKPRAKTARPVVGTSYRLFNVRTGMCLGNVTGNDTTPTIQKACGNSEKLRLEVTREVAGVTQYRLRDVVGADLCLDPPGRESNLAGTGLTPNACLDANTDNQEWQLQDIGQAVRGRAVFLLVNSASGLCLGVSGTAGDKSDLIAGLPLTISPCGTKADGFDDHRWTFN